MGPLNVDGRLPATLATFLSLYVTPFVSTMRRIGFISDAAQAKRFCDYLVTLSIDAKPDEDTVDQQPSWGIWIRDEMQVDRGREELAAFQNAPDDAKYAVSDQANKIREEKIAQHQRRLKQQQKLARKMPAGGTMGGGFSARQQGIPVTIAIIAISVICGFATNFGRPHPSRAPGKLSLEEKLYGTLSFVDRRDYAKSGGDSLASLSKGEVWRIVTPMFMHGSTMHLAFNMLAMFFLGSVLERIHGSVFLAILAVLTHAIGMAVQVSMPGAESLPEALAGLAGSPFVIGASGAVYGLFGYIWVRPTLDPSFPIRMSPTNVAMMMGWLVICIFTNNNVANGAHLGGLIAGMLFAVVVVSVAKPGRQ